MIHLTRFMLINPTTGEFRTIYGTKTQPALYLTRGLAEGELKKLKKAGRPTKGYEVIVVEVKNKYEW